ncbi:MAG TPA: hypothetical protein PKY01_11225 [Candidatus Hydrogenedentes bacterium]|nr:hypothetical protein [Candidatus Hydrogenedentota bacterium]
MVGSHATARVFVELASLLNDFPFRIPERGRGACVLRSADGAKHTSLA